MSITTLLFLGLSLASAPQQSPTDVLIRISGPLTIGAGESAGAAVVINGDAVIDGAVTGQLIVVNGSAVVRGRLQGGATVFGGRLTLEPTAQTEGAIVLYRSVLERSPSARVGGRIVSEIIPSYREVAWLVWVATTLVLVLAALTYTYLARTQLSATAELIRRRPGRVGLAALLTVLGLPLTAFVLLLTGVGLPVAIALLVFVLPVLAFLGYLITGTSVGQLITGAEPRLAGRPFIAAALGVLVLQLLAAVPPLGGLFALFATQVGAGALAYYVWRQHQRVPDASAAVT